MSQPIQNCFERYEKKYFLTPAGQKALLQIIVPYIKMDFYGKYTICNLYYDGLFDDIFAQYTRRCTLTRVKTSNMGTLYELEYVVVLPEDVPPKAFLDALRCRNGNLNITCGRESSPGMELL